MTAPYYADDLVTLYHGDCRDILPAIGCVSAVVTDPPYGQTSLPWDRWVDGWLHLLPTDSLWCFGTLRMFMEHAGDFTGWKLSQDVIWEKHNGSGFDNERFKRVHEQPAHFYRGRWEGIYKQPQYVNEATKRTVRRKQRPPHMGHIEAGSYESHDGGPKMMRSVIAVRSMHGSAEHPTQKPIGILQPLIRYSVPPGGSLVDPFAGSGSTLIAAARIGIKAIGIEAREDYCEVAARNLSRGAELFSEVPA